MAATVQASFSSQQSIVIEDLLNEILDDVIATAVHRQLSSAGLAPAAKKSCNLSKAASAAGAALAGTAIKSSGGAAAAAADLMAPQFSGGVVCVLDASMAQQPCSSTTLLKEGVDRNCDTEFGLESLEAEGPADSWLVDAEGAAVTDPSRVFCKGPSWDRFVDKMKSAGGKDNESCKQQQPRSTRTSSTGAIKEETPAEEAAVAAAASEGAAVAALGSRSSSLAGKQQASLSRSNSSTARRPGSAAGSLRASVELTPAGPAATEQPETSSNLLRRSSSRPLSSSGANKSRPASAEQPAAASPAVAAAGDALRLSFDARRSERLSSGGGSREADSWSKSLRSRAPASSTFTEGGGSQRR
jgi:hypothetical protein